MKNAKYITWLIILAVMSILLSGRIKFWMPDYSHMDLVKYQTMAEASPQISTEVIQPFAFRIAAPWIAGLLPVSSEVSFYILNTISLIILAIVFYKFLVLNKIEYRISFALTACFIFNRYFFQFNAWDYFHLGDVITIILLLLILMKVLSRDWMIILPLMLIGVLVKESILILIPVIFTYLFFSKSSLKEYQWFALINISTITLFIAIRIIIEPVGGESLWEQFSTGLIYFLTPTSFIKKLIIAFTPFGLIPFLFYKETYSFLKDQKHFAVLMVGTLIISFFGDAERLMVLASPAYFALIGVLIQTYLNEKNYKNELKKILTYLIITSFAASFYHLWGIFQLPNSMMTIISTIITSIVVAYFFWKIKYKQKIPNTVSY